MPPPSSLIPAGTAPFRHVTANPRSDVGFQAKYFTSPGGERVGVLSGGVNIIIEGLTVEGLPASLGPLGTVDIEADRIVGWGMPEISTQQIAQRADEPLEIYLEGNIVFRQGDRVVYADRMFYDARRQVGTILSAELFTPPPPVGGFQYQGLVRLKAAAVRQLDASRFVASDALLTTSRLEDPAYSFESQTITLTDQQQPQVDPYTGMVGVNPATGEPAYAHQYQVQSQSNFLKVAGIPVLYWPTFATTLEKPTFYVNNFRVRNDSIFGFQVLTDLDAFQLLGYQDAPAGVNWDLNLDYLSQRGLGFGTTVDYDRDSFFNLPGPTKGRVDSWFIDDRGLDNLGLGRRDVRPEEKFRGRVFWNHRQKLVGGWLDDWTVEGEVGWISDRTFMEEYYENEWDNNKDQLTGLELKRLFDNKSLSIAANGRLNDFFTQTQWLPRGDFYWLGESLFDDTTTLYSHSSAAYANIGIATPPTNPTLLSQWTLLPWEVDSLGNPTQAKGERFVTRSEIDYPIDVSPFKVVPYAMGEYGHWGADLEGNNIDRLWGQVGLRGSIPFWAVDPTVRDPLFNLNGLAHKVVFDAEASYADANQNFTEFPLYDPIDDVSVVEFRRRLFFAPVGSPVLAGQFDPKFDPRYWAIRSGIQDDVSATSMELADDLTAVRFGMRHRLQTQAQRAGRGADRRLDDVRLERDLVPRFESRQLRSGHRPDRLRLAVVHRRPLQHPLRRGGRHLWQRLQNRLARRHDQPTNGWQRLPRLPHDGRAVHGQSDHRIGQLSHEHQMDRLGDRLDRPGQLGQHRPVVPHQPNWRIADRHGRGQLRPIEKRRRLQLPGRAPVPAEAQRHAPHRHRDPTGGRVWAGVEDRSQVSGVGRARFLPSLPPAKLRRTRILDFWNTVAKHDSVFHKSLSLSPLLSRNA